MGTSLGWTAPGAESPDAHFRDQVLPILQQRCFECHSHDQKIKAGLALDSRAGWELGGETGPAVIAGKPDESLLITAIRYADADLQMPPKNRMPDHEIAILEKWVRDGAYDPRTSLGTVEKGGIDMVEGAKAWPFQPLNHSPVPQPRDASWARDDVDRFILAALDAHNLTPAKDADRQTFIRRLWFALLGLPPSPEDVRAFLADQRPDAYERLVDRALESVHFGERWGRRWMDVVHYSETHGLERDSLLPFAWRYRDYLIRAFNADVPYDRFVEEHVAGDLISPRWHDGKNEAVIGTAFWRFVEFFQTPVDVKREEIAVIDTQIDTFSKGFQAMTLSCARCHDHKFDPMGDEDFYAMYGILRSSRAATHILEAPEVFVRENAVLERIKSAVPPLIAPTLSSQLEKWPQRLQDAAAFIGTRPTVLERERPFAEQLPTDPWRRTFALATWAKKNVLFAQFLPLVKAENEEAFRKTWQEIARASASPLEPLPAGGRVYADFRVAFPTGWRVSGPGLSPEVQPAGSYALTAQGDQSVRAVRPAGYFSDALSDRHGGMLRSPDFTIQDDCISVLAGGHQGARARLVIENFQGDSTLYAGVNPTLEFSHLQWYTWRMRDQWKGRRAYIEFFTRDDRPYVEIGPIREKFEETDGRSGFGVVEIIFHPAAWQPRMKMLPDSFWQQDAADWQEVGRRLASASEEAFHAWRSGNATEQQLFLLCEVVSLGLLETRLDRTSAAMADVMERYRFHEARIPQATRVPGLRDDGNGLDSDLFPRGNHLKSGPAIPRRYLEVLGSSPVAYQAAGSGRLSLAKELVSPANPLTARVMVNRIWHWLFGQGLVPTVDNFGKLGAKPSHPELLDYLATEFVNDGWSIKRLVRRLVLSRTWRLSSDPSADAQERDPGNLYLQHALVRRLEAEEIRDALLAVAGNLNPDVGGAPVRNFYRVSVDTSQPPSGPLDGHGRRSLYLEMRRNCRSDFLQAFDQPSPAMTTGARTLSNVPAQSLALLNDPFVLHQANVWAERVRAEFPDPLQRLTRMYEEALGRPPRTEEVSRLRPLFLAEADSVEAWTSIAHILINQKEFLYIP
ncbi:MAG TPA: PSD1 and planctomycete cytochrome C domain-containing protein [Opitutaceae bacterium]|nr:PSD1 and planctomycete cytochrome C domain-containing protein [Opitutaceae bacterium]